LEKINNMNQTANEAEPKKEEITAKEEQTNEPK